MKPMRPAAATSIAVLLLAGCLVNIQPAPRTPRPTASPSPTATATHVPTLAPSPTPGLAGAPRFTAGDRVTVSAPGLRVRARPGVEQRVIVSLGFGARLLVALGPVWVEDAAWYEVRAAAPDLRFAMGWVAAGTDADPFLSPATFEVGRNPYLAGTAGEGDGTLGPLTLANDKVSIAWLAAPPTAAGCSFFVDLTPSGREPVRAIRATIGGVPAPGELFASFFKAHHGLVRQKLRVSVASECSWALTFVREPPQPEAIR